MQICVNEKRDIGILLKCKELGFRACGNKAVNAFIITSKAWNYKI